jgi:uncharacterized protein (TIGR00725 family)
MIDFRKKIRIGVIGGAQPDQESLQVAFKVGQLIAENQAILVCGGLRGIMEASSKGAKLAGGMTIGILPGNLTKEANPYVDIPIATGLGYSRNSLVAMNSDILIAIDGQYGTLTEIAYGRIYGKKIIGLKTWDITGVIKAKTAEEAIKIALSG